MQLENVPTDTAAPRTAAGRRVSARERRGAEQRQALRALVIGGAPSVEVDPDGLAEAVLWWSSRPWLPRELADPLRQLERASRRLVERPDRALNFELSRMAVSLSGTLGDALAGGGSPSPGPGSRPRVVGCPVCGATGAGRSWPEPGLELVELPCSRCSIRAVQSTSGSAAHPQVLVDQQARTVTVGSHVVPVAVCRHDEAVVVAAVPWQTLAPVLLVFSTPDASW